MRIFKYPIVKAFEVCDGPIEIHAPGAFYLCHVGPDPSGDLCIWAQVDTTQFPGAKIRADVFGTGHEIPDDIDLEHLGSYVSGAFVWHVFAGITYEGLDRIAFGGSA